MIPLVILVLLPACVQAQESKLDEALPDAAGHVAIFVRMTNQVFPEGGDYERFCAEQPASVDRLELRAQVVQQLQQKSDRSYAKIQVALDQMIENGEVRSLKRYWIVNGFACEATGQARQKLADLKGVGFVYRQRYVPQHETPSQAAELPETDLIAMYRKLQDDRRAGPDEPFNPEAMEIPWNLKAVGVDRAWAQHGVTGKGVVVAVLDDGMMSVPALTPSLWHNANEKLNGIDDDGNGYIDDVFGYNFRQNNPYNVTPSGHRHGTLCAGIIAARPTTGKTPIATGVAPDAKVMPLVGNGQLRAYEYAIEQGADVLSMSYTFEPRTMGQYRGLYRTAHEHLSAAGVVSVGGAGNYATRWPVGMQIGSTKDIPCVIAAAGIRENDQVPASSSRGPVSWKGIRYFDQYDRDNPPLSKPDVTSCNGGFPMWTRAEVWDGPRKNRLREIVYEDDAGYVLAIGPSGNSFSGPHAAGIAALMLEANPQLPVWHLKRIMEATCQDMGEPGRDTTHGAGMLQADKAVQAVLDFSKK